MTVQGFDAARSLGRRLIFESSLTKASMYQYTCAWGWWTSFCQDEGVSPLAASVDDALRFFESEYSEPGTRIKSVRRAVGFVYRALGMASPLHDTGVQWPNNDGLRHYKPLDDLCEESVERYERFVREYIAWCNCNGVPALPGSPQQVADFLVSLRNRYEMGSVRYAGAAACRYLDPHGHRGMGRHPVVMTVLAKRRVGDQRVQREEPAVPSPPFGKLALRFHAHWVQWCDSQSMDWQSASAADALRYLRGLEHQKDAGLRATRLSRFYDSTLDPFSSEEVIVWKEWHRRASRAGTLPASPSGSRAAQVLAKLRASRATFDGPVPAGLTREEVEFVSDDFVVRRADTTWLNHAGSLVNFQDWLSQRELSLDQVADAHVGVYLRERARLCRISTVESNLIGLSVMFDEMGVNPNPARGVRAINALDKLKVERPEAPAQMPAFRKVHFDAVIAHYSRAISGENSELVKMRAMRVLALFGIMFDGLLRRGEVAAARWSDIKLLPNGGGALAVPFTKTTKFGDGPATYVSPGTMEYLHEFRKLRRILVREKSDDPRIFQCSGWTIGQWVKKTCEAVGLEDEFASHSLRIGMACELAVAGFSLPLIMLAGRWKKPEMVVYYIRDLKPDDSAVALFYKMQAEGRIRASDEMAGIDVLSTYHHVVSTLY